MGASFEEKSVWIQLAGVVLGTGAYFVVAGAMMWNGVRALPAYAGPFMVAMVLMVVLMVAGFIVTALSGRREDRDERDRLIAWRSEYHSSWLLAVGVLAGVTAMVFSVDNVWVAHLLFASLVLSEVLALVLRLRDYRRGL